MDHRFFRIEQLDESRVLRLISADNTNRLTRACVLALSAAISELRGTLEPLTGWGGTQRLPRLIGKGPALELFAAAEKITAARALQIGLVNAVAENPLAEARRWIKIRNAEISPTEPATNSGMHTSTPGRE